MKQFLEKIMNRENLTIEETEKATRLCFDTDVTDTEMSAFLTALKVKGETADEMTGIVNTIRSYSDYQSIILPGIMDNCGTGGDRSYSFNISTTAAFVIAGAGVKIAKHGNRSISSKTGSADLLEHLGISLEFTKDDVEYLLKTNNIAFLFAPHIHDKLKTFIKTRSELGLPTVFNLIGPLTNPINLHSQLLGVYRRDMLMTVAETLKNVGRERAIVINGAGEMDEASLAGTNHLILLENGKLTEFTITPEDVGLPRYDNNAILGGDAKTNADILYSVLNNEPSAYLDTVLLNAGLALFANNHVKTIKDGINEARISISTGAALEKLTTLIDYSKDKVEV